ncbi:MAG: hypothetical protein JNM95_14250, partial [Chitinophagaceae bacterium]|nr:hypothetical protein [Chitinophagaceae bacterium]MBL7774022.1 hypothetical protein [Chitinophagaceae bacterium]
MKYLIVLFILVSTDLIHAQEYKRSWNWTSGYAGNSIQFISGNITTAIGQFPQKYFTAGNSCISDTNGNLLIHSNGFHVLNNQ